MIRLANIGVVAGALLLASCAGAPPTPQPKPGPSPDPAGPGPVATPSPGPKQPLPPVAPLHRLGNLVTVNLLPHHSRDPAQIQLGILAGSDLGQPGLAELTAEVLVRGASAASGRKSLAETIDQLAGTIDVEVSPLTTLVTIRVPHFRWKQAQRALADALATPTVSRSQIERIREELATRRIDDIRHHPGAEVPRSFLLGYSSTAEHIAALLERDPSEVVSFFAQLYRSDGAIATLQVPGSSPEILGELENGLGRWPLPTTPRQPLPLEERRLDPALHWAPSNRAGLCRAMLVLPLPDPASPQAAELLVVHACLTLDGIGGRLERLQRERHLDHVSWQSSILRIATVPALLLTADVTPTDAAALWAVAKAARKSLVELPPTRSERELAIRRARLTARLLAADATHRNNVTTAFAIQGKVPEALDRAILSLGAPDAFRAARATNTYARLPAAMIVLGGQPPSTAEDLKTFDLLPPGAIERLENPGPSAQVDVAAPWLQGAVEAVGGPESLRRLEGFRFRCTISAEAAPTVEERVEWDGASGLLVRERKLLDQTIETRLEGEKGSEKSGDETIPLSPGEIARMRREMRRHPVALLAAYAQGRLRFRPIARRTVADRDLMILESVGGEFDRLRIHVDAVSHLIRRIEVWERTAEGTFAHIEESWSDYRSVDGLRVPYRRLTVVDDGDAAETLFLEWTPARRP